MSTGLFWSQEHGQKKKKYRPLAPIPDTGWVRPTYFPDLSSAKAIGIDLETKDPELMTKGPGWARGVGHIVGASVATDDGYVGYFPMRHEVEPQYNFEPDKVLQWLRHQLSNPNQAKVGANITYDYGWLRHEGVDVKGHLFDVQFAEALLEESAKIALEKLGQKYCNQGKESEVMYQWCALSYGGKPNQTQRSNIYRTPPRLTGFYAESDAWLPIAIFLKQWNLLRDQGLLDVFMMETELIPLIVAMREAGVDVDVPKAEQLNVELRYQAAEVQRQLDRSVGFEVNVNASASLAKAFDKLGIPYPWTSPSKSFPNGQPSFTGDFLKTVTHPVGSLVSEIKAMEKFNGTFIESYILDSHVNGKVYGQFHQLRSDGNGTRSGRLASSKPNLQNIPSRDEVTAPKIRGLFIPEHGHVGWRKYDYSQIEYRFFAHFATGEGAEEIVMQYANDPTTDFHDVVIKLILSKTGLNVKRKPAKTINFGLLYGMGLKLLCEKLGISFDEGKQLFKAYHSGVPFAQSTLDYYSGMASETGEIRTIMGRKSRFNRWEPDGRKLYEGEVPLNFHAALATWGPGIKRAATHKAFNRVLQGSAADMMKKGMLMCYKSGVFDYTGIPKLTVHDELNWSDPGGQNEAFAEAQHIMETCMPLKVPVKVDAEIGPHWGTVLDLDKYFRQKGVYGNSWGSAEDIIAYKKRKKAAIV